MTKSISKSSALKLLNHVWHNVQNDSWERVNHSMRNALELAIDAGMKFTALDFHVCASAYRWHYWTGNSPAIREWIYAHAIIVGNQSAVEAYEKFLGRKPFFANDVSADCWRNGGYIHANHVNRKRERLFVGAEFRHKHENGSTLWRITTINDEKGIIRAVCGKTRGVFNHVQLAAMCPAPKKEAWKKIKSAPTKGRIAIWLKVGDREPQAAWSDTWWTAGFSVECKPTHWKPRKEKDEELP